jgi:hypothetical protein
VIAVSDQLYAVTSFPPLWWAAYVIGVRAVVRWCDARDLFGGH